MEERILSRHTLRRCEGLSHLSAPGDGALNRAPDTCFGAGSDRSPVVPQCRLCSLAARLRVSAALTCDMTLKWCSARSATGELSPELPRSRVRQVAPRSSHNPSHSSFRITSRPSVIASTNFSRHRCAPGGPYQGVMPSQRPTPPLLPDFVRRYYLRRSIWPLGSGGATTLDRTTSHGEWRCAARTCESAHIRCPYPRAFRGRRIPKEKASPVMEYLRFRDFTSETLDC